MRRFWTLATKPILAFLTIWFFVGWAYIAFGMWADFFPAQCDALGRAVCRSDEAVDLVLIGLMNVLLSIVLRLMLIHNPKRRDLIRAFWGFS